MGDLGSRRKLRFESGTAEKTFFVISSFFPVPESLILIEQQQDRVSEQVVAGSPLRGREAETVAQRQGGEAALRIPAWPIRVELPVALKW